MFDVSGLTEVKMRKRNGWQGSYYIDREGICKAKTCVTCKELLGADGFRKDVSHKTNLSVYCKSCLRDKAKSLVNRSDDEVYRDRMALRPNGTKLCYECDKIYTLDMFYRSRDNRDGLQDSCKECDKSTKRGTKDPAYNQIYRSRMKARSKTQIENDAADTHPSGSKSCTKCSVSMSLECFYPDIRRKDGRRDMCRDCTKEASRLKRLKPHIDYWMYVGIPLECYICGGTWSRPDHVIPEKLGGLDASFNRLPICIPCNSSKWAHPLGEWLYRIHPDIADQVLNKVTVSYGMSI